MGSKKSFGQTRIVKKSYRRHDAFESRGGDLAHYVGDPVSDNIAPYQTDHAPILA